MRTKIKIALGIFTVIFIILAAQHAYVHRPLQPEPVAIKEVHAFTENLDADPENELVYWFSLVDKDGNEIACDGKLCIRFAGIKRSWIPNPDMITIHKSDFRKAKVGRAEFERTVLLYTNTIDVSDCLDDFHDKGLAYTRLKLCFITETGKGLRNSYNLKYIEYYN